MDKRQIKIIGDAVVLALNATEQSRKHKKETFDFPDYLQIDNKIKLAEKLKEGFRTEKGRDIKFLILILQEKGILPDVNLKPIYEALAIYMDRDIGSYEIIRRTKHISPMHDFAYNKIASRIELILTNIG